MTQDNKQRELGILILETIHRHPPVSSGLRWGIKTLRFHINRSQTDILSALSWLKSKGLVQEDEGHVVLTTRGRELVS